MTKRERKTFSKEFKEQIVQLHLSGKPRSDSQPIAVYEHPYTLPFVYRHELVRSRSFVANALS
ncbi:hypothetical protein J32TS6_13470 [Virgibacillus pantothenticus]|nr:hypothetical protein J32TS6_13470 [Virgibacillus pantothenticus]